MFLFKKNIKYLEKSNAVVLMGTDPSFFLFFFFFSVCLTLCMFCFFLSQQSLCTSFLCLGTILIIKFATRSIITRNVTCANTL